MKKVILMAAAILTLGIADAAAQTKTDLIIKKDGTEIKAQVQKVGTSEVEYRKAGSADGPLYTLSKKDILLIKYADGENEVFGEAAQSASGGGLSEYKYTFGNRISSTGSEKSPFGAAVLSFVLPGVGQFYCGDIAGGLLFLVVGPVLASTAYYVIDALTLPAREVSDNRGVSYVKSSDEALFVAACIYLASEIGSIIHAPYLARRVNRARGYALLDNVGISPVVGRVRYANQTINTAGLALSIRF